ATRLRVDRAARVGVALVLAFLPFALGRHAPFYRALFALPGGDLFRYPAKLAVPELLGLALAASAGVDGVARARRTTLAALGALVVSSIAGAALLVVARGPLAARIDALGVATVDGRGAVAALVPRLVHVAVVALGALAVILARRSERRTTTALV